MVDNAVGNAQRTGDIGVIDHAAVIIRNGDIHQASPAVEVQSRVAAIIHEQRVGQGEGQRADRARAGPFSVVLGEDAIRNAQGLMGTNRGARIVMLVGVNGVVMEVTLANANVINLDMDAARVHRIAARDGETLKRAARAALIQRHDGLPPPAAIIRR